MWNNYFYQIQTKYNMRISKNKPLVIRFDGKDVTKDKTINLLDMYKNGFLDSLQKTAWYFSYKYNCYTIVGSDELSIIFEDPTEMLGILDSTSDHHSNEITSLLSQYFFDYFNNYYQEKKIFWHGKCFSIPKEKIKSYIKYRSTIIKNVMVTYFLIRKNNNSSKEKLDEKLLKCKQYNDFEILNNIKDGILFYKGKRLDIQEFFKGNILEIEEISTNSDNLQNKTSDDTGFEIEFTDM